MLEEFNGPTPKFAQSVRQSISESVEKAENPVEKGRLFLKWVLTNLFDASEDDADNQILDGANDEGIDAFLENTSEETGIMRLFQVKYGKSHKPEAVLKLQQDIQNFLKKKPKDIKKDDTREVLHRIRDEKLDVEAIYVTDQEIDFDGTDSFRVYGFKQIVNKLWEDITGQATGKIEKIKLQEYVSYNNTIIGVISLSDLAKFVNNTKKYIFESNVRKFLKGKTRVNRNLRDTLSKEPESVLYYNNGITIVVKKFKELNEKIIELEEPQIVNGAQTSSTIAEVLRNDPEIRGDISITIINETTKATRNQITRFRNSQNAVKGKDLISLQKFHTSIHGQLKNLGYFYEQQAGSWLNMADDEKAKYSGNPIFNEYLDKEPGMKIGAKDAIQAMVAGITQDPTTPYGSISKFMPEGKHYADVFTDKLPDDYRLLFYPYLVKTYAEKAFNYGSRNSEIQEKKYARLLFITAYFRIMQEFLLDDAIDWKMQPQVLDPYFKDFETNKKILEFTNKMLDHYFVQAESIHKGKMTLHTFFAKYAWIEELQDKFMSYVRRNERELKDIKKQFKLT